MRAVFARKISLVLLPLLFAFAQNAQAQKWHHFDARPFNLGFTMGLTLGGYDMTTHPNQFDEQTGWMVRDVELVRKPGIYLGLITNLKLADNFDFRFMPSVSLEERDFRFFMDDSLNGGEPVVMKKIEASNLNLPMVIKCKSNYYRNIRVWFQLGIQPSVNLASNKKVKDDPDLLKTQKFDIATVAAFGVDLYGEKLKLSPEIRFTRGIRNIYVPLRTRFPRAISDLFSQLLVLNINFE